MISHQELGPTYTRPRCAWCGQTMIQPGVVLPDHAVRSDDGKTWQLCPGSGKFAESSRQALEIRKVES